MRIVVTFGPSYEPIDQVRRITNFSSGALGTFLAGEFVRAGHEVLCFRGVGATCSLPIDGARIVPFDTNASLRARLEAVENRHEVDAFFHVAALSDYTVKSIRTAGGGEARGAKIPSRAGELIVTLAPALKLIPELRALFPSSRIVGWKYELDGTPEDALAAGRRQMETCRTDACVVNGAAYGAGFGFCTTSGALFHCAHSNALAERLLQWLARPVQE